MYLLCYFPDWHGFQDGKYCVLQEAMFEVAVRQDVYEERQNQLRWQIKLGDDQMTAKKRLKTLESRQESWIEYKAWISNVL